MGYRARPHSTPCVICGKRFPNLKALRQHHAGKHVVCEEVTSNG